MSPQTVADPEALATDPETASTISYGLLIGAFLWQLFAAVAGCWLFGRRDLVIGE